MDAVVGDREICFLALWESLRIGHSAHPQMQLKGKVLGIHCVVELHFEVNIIFVFSA